MTPKTLRQERIEKFLKILEDYYQDNPPTKDATEYNTNVAELLADAAPARTEKKAEALPSQKPEIDKVAAWLAMSQFPGAQREARTDALLSYFAETLRRTTTSKEWLEFAKWVDNRQQKHGEKAQVFVEWLRGQKNYDPQFWPVSKMMEFWPSAFVSVQSSHRSERLEREL